MERIICFLIGYFSGSFLTAVFVVRKVKHCSVFQIGTGNPGMANVMAQCGFWPGILVLAGDVFKVVLACLICYLLFGRMLPWAVLSAYAGLGAVTGHNFPFWHRFRGGKGVSCTCAALFCVNPLYALAAMVLGMIVCFATKYLAIGAIVIPAAFLPVAYYIYGREIFILTSILAVIMLLEHFPGLRRICSGAEQKVDVLGKILRRNTRQ